MHNLRHDGRNVWVVQAIIMTMEDAMSSLVEEIADLFAEARQRSVRHVVVILNCKSGRHRSVGVAELVAKSPFSTADTYDTHTLAEDIRLDEQAVLGRITVSAGYSFLPQERELLRAVAGHISIFISRRHDQELLRERCKELKLLHHH